MSLEIKRSAPQLTEFPAFWQAYSDLITNGYALVLTSTNLCEGDFGYEVAEVFKTPLPNERFLTTNLGYSTFSLEKKSNDMAFHRFWENRPRTLPCRR